MRSWGPRVDSASRKTTEATTSSGPIIGPGHSFTSDTHGSTALVLGKDYRPGWRVGLEILFSLLMLLNLMIGLLLTKGVGIGGINIPIGCGFRMVTFVWWIGIGHA